MDFNTTRVDERRVEELFYEWTNYRQEDISPRFFIGVLLTDIPALEECFKINIFVYTLGLIKPNEQPMDGYYELPQQPNAPPGLAAKLVIRSLGRFKARKLFLNLHKNHFSLIKDINKYACCWRCQGCDRLLRSRRNFNKHVKKCSFPITKTYQGGGFGLPLTIFDKLVGEGYSFKPEERLYPYRAVFDYEARFEQSDGSMDTQNVVFDKKLVPVSFSITSNVPGYTVPSCTIRRNPDELIQEFMLRLDAISSAAHSNLSEKFNTITDQLCINATNAHHAKEYVRALKLAGAQEYEIEVAEAKAAYSNRWLSIRDEWERWTRQMPVLGFNSAKFDINLIRQYLIPHLLNNDNKTLSPIVRDTSYLMLATDTLMFLDISNYLAAGTSYSGWLKGFGVTEEKGKFPYEWLTDFDRLEQRQLPSQEQFYSSLRQEGITDADYLQLQQVWNEQQFKTMRDLLIWYNNKDVGPFLRCTNKMLDIMAEMNIDMFKSGNISLPGLAMCHMFQDVPPDVIYQTFGPENSNIADMVRENIVGGPSIIFNRFVMSQTGNIKGSTKVPAAVHGYDANALYGWGIGQNMPVGIGIIWKPVTEGFHVPAKGNPEEKQHCLQLINQNDKRVFTRNSAHGFDEWMFVCYIYETLKQQHPGLKLTLRHHFNGGQKAFCFGSKTIVSVDGWIPELQTIIQYHGCFWHGHECHLTRHVNMEYLNERRLHHNRIQQYLNLTGCQIIERFECQFKNQMRNTPSLRNYVEAHRVSHQCKMSQAGIIEQIRTNQIFGMVEVDVQVPFWETERRQTMSEFPPLFKNTDIRLEDVGETMEAFGRDNGIMLKPRRSLISSFFAEKILLATPLMQWYLNHGLIVTRVHSLIQYQPNATFAPLCDEVTRHRKKADSNPSYKAYGETFKLMGNSYYGKCCTNIDKHRCVKFLRTQEAAQSVCDPLFRKVEYITNDVYEVHLAKGHLKYKLPVNIAFFVYSYAKLRMLQFYYDFLCEVLPFDSFELTEMDTDSLYMSLSHQTIEEAVPGDRRALYDALKHSFMVIDESRDKRTPGLFKLEWRGNGMICLCSKSYIAFTIDKDSEGNELISNIKLSTKGLNKQTNCLSVEEFRAALLDKSPATGTNRGFIRRNQALWQYSQLRTGLTYFYPKRKVAEDGIHTTPLDI